MERFDRLYAWVLPPLTFTPPEAAAVAVGLSRSEHVLRLRWIDVGAVETEREVEPQHVVVGPNGSWCHLRHDDRVSRCRPVTATSAMGTLTGATMPHAPRPRSPREPASG